MKIFSEISTVEQGWLKFSVRTSRSRTLVEIFSEFSAEMYLVKISSENFDIEDSGRKNLSENSDVRILGLVEISSEISWWNRVG